MIDPVEESFFLIVQRYHGEPQRYHRGDVSEWKVWVDDWADANRYTLDQVREVYSTLLDEGIKVSGVMAMSAVGSELLWGVSPE